MAQDLRKLEGAFRRCCVVAALPLVLVSSRAYAQGATLEWNTSPGVHTYRYSASDPAAARHTVELDVRSNSPALLKLDAEEPFAVRFSKDGSLAVVPGYSGKPPTIPAYTQLFMIGATAGGALAVGGSYTFRLPADADIPDTQLTVQSEVRVKLTDLKGNVAVLDFETAYRVIQNGALNAFKADISGLQQPAGDTPIHGMLDQAREFRLAGFGTVEFDRSAGHMISGRFTGAGLPSTSLTRDQLARHRNAFTYTLVRLE